MKKCKLFIHSFYITARLFPNLRYGAWTSDSYCGPAANYDSILILTIDSLLTLGKRQGFGLLISMDRRLFPALLFNSIYFIFNLSITSLGEVDSRRKIITAIICDVLFSICSKGANFIFLDLLKTFGKRPFRQWEKDQWNSLILVWGREAGHGGAAKYKSDAS